METWARAEVCERKDRRVISPRSGRREPYCGEGRSIDLYGANALDITPIGVSEVECQKTYVLIHLKFDRAAGAVSETHITGPAKPREIRSNGGPAAQRGVFSLVEARSQSNINDVIPIVGIVRPRVTMFATLPAGTFGLTLARLMVNNVWPLTP